jgi:DtxR family Mn-dependent transcriptional regulator
VNSLNEENYLKTLFHLADEKGEINTKDLSDRLNIKMPSVTNMMKKLADKGLVNYESYKPIILTEKGKKESALIIRKHRLTEMFLVEKLGFSWEEVHDIAEQIEHVKSPPFFRKMDEILGFPKFDPHGSPIPDKNGKIIARKWKKMNKCKAGDILKLTGVSSSNDDFLKFLNSRGIHLGLEMKILNVEPFDNSMLVTYSGQEVTLSNMVCKRLLVE